MPFQWLVFEVLSKITLPTAWIILIGTERYVCDGIVTSLTCKYLQTKNKALVQLSTVTTYLAPVYSEISS